MLRTFRPSRPPRPLREALVGARASALAYVVQLLETRFPTIKIPIGRLALANPDTLTIRVKGLSAEKSSADAQVILTRPYLGRMAFQIVGIVLCAVAALLSLLGALWTMGVLKT
ncbi:MAG: hypothetical protein ABIZ04_01945 [Opitutus sp.]